MLQPNHRPEAPFRFKFLQVRDSCRRLLEEKRSFTTGPVLSIEFAYTDVH